MTGAAVVIPAAETGAEAPAAAGDKKFGGGKYATVEEFEKGHAELEKKFGASRPADPAKPEVKPANGEGATPAEPSLTLQKPVEVSPPKGFDLHKAREEFAKDGKLSDATYKSFAGAGFDKAQVDEYIEGQKALASQRVSKVSEKVGGEEHLKALQAYALDHYSEAELAAFNTLASSTNIETVMLAYEGLKARFADAMGRDPSLVGGEGGAAGGDVFKSMTEMTDAVGTPEYKTNPAHRQKIEAKIQRTNFEKLAR